MISDSASISTSGTVSFTLAKYSPMTGRTAFRSIARYLHPPGPSDRPRILWYSLESWCRTDFVWTSNRQPMQVCLSGNAQGKPPPVMTHRQPSCLDTALPEAISCIREGMSAPDEITSSTASLAWESELSQIRIMFSIPEGRIPTSLISFVWSWMGSAA